MIYRVSFYLKAEVVEGRAPRYMVDVEADSLKNAQAQVMEKEGVVIRSAYKAPPIRSVEEVAQRNKERLRLAKAKLKSPDLQEDCGKFTEKPYSGNTFPHSKDKNLCRTCLNKFIEVQTAKIKSGEFPSSEAGVLPQQPSYVFVTDEARNKWYSSHKSQNEERQCHECGVHPVERYKRLCSVCRSKRKDAAGKQCIGCNISIPSNSRKRFCPTCTKTRKEEQERLHREKRAKINTVERIREQVAASREQLKTTTLPACKLASRFQGLRQPHVDKVDDQGNLHTPPNRCRACLQKFIDVQTVYLSNILAENIPEVNLFEETKNAHSAAVGR